MRAGVNPKLATQWPTPPGLNSLPIETGGRATPGYLRRTPPGFVRGDTRIDTSKVPLLKSLLRPPSLVQTPQAKYFLVSCRISPARAISSSVL